MKIKSNLKEYNVIMEDDINFIKDILRIDHAEYVIDRNVYQLYETYFKTIPQERLILIDALEENKVLDTALEICERMTEIPAKRNAVLVSVGGGIIQDITGFAANILYRGIRWIFVPTTLLASCDSCIGGKTSLNYKKYKNLLGTFYPPDEIHICAQFFKTLSDRDFQSGLGEVVKFNIMAGPKGLSAIENNISALLKREDSVVNDFIESSLVFKKTFIEADEFDQGERIKLNFAHTFGHAIEVITEYAIPHGTAVAIGMIMANSVSVKRGLLSEDVSERSEQVLLKVININSALLGRETEDYIRVMRKDKKQTGNSLTAVLMSDKVEKENLTVVHDLTEEEVQSATEHFLRLYQNKKQML